MAEPVAYIYEPFVGIIDDGRQVLVQLFRNPETGEVKSAQIAFRAFSWDTWGMPFPLEVRK
jgi:hypothetical protein